MKKIELFLAVLLVSSSAFSDDANTKLKVIINNQLPKDIRAEFVPLSYDENVWNGKCIDTIYTTSRKQLCSQYPEFTDGIPVSLPLTHTDEKLQSEISFFDNQSGLWWYSHPFNGHIMIKTLDGMPIADISYSMKGHDANYLSKFTHHIKAEQGKFAMWDPIEVISHNSKVDVRIEEAYSNGNDWCHLSDTIKIDTSKGLCDASPVITLTTSSSL